jgi:DNA repair exonuclease SbcCD ATPase subunit
MITFTRLTYANFLSVGNSEISIDLNSTRSTLVVGHNGAGKSLMLDALSFALFGKPHRNINKPQLVNSINGKNCVVTVEFKIGPVEYKIIRGLKPNLFEIWQNGILVNQESHSRDYQKLLETNILKLNHKSFHQVVVLGSSNFIPFMQLSAHARREVIEDLLDIGIFSKMNAVLKETSSKLKDSLKDTDNQLHTLKEKINLQEQHIDSLNQISEQNTKIGRAHV